MLESRRDVIWGALLACDWRNWENVEDSNLRLDPGSCLKHKEVHRRLVTQSATEVNVEKYFLLHSAWCVDEFD